jgi:hypothetical protein
MHFKFCNIFFYFGPKKFLYTGQGVYKWTMNSNELSMNFDKRLIIEDSHYVWARGGKTGLPARLAHLTHYFLTDWANVLNLEMSSDLPKDPDLWTHRNKTNSVNKWS